MLSPELEAELRAIIGSELDARIERHIRDAFAELMQHGLGPIVRRLTTIEESLGLVVDGQAKIETALAGFTGTDDANEPWRESLEDVRLDDDAD